MTRSRRRGSAGTRPSPGRPVRVRHYGALALFTAAFFAFPSGEGYGQSRDQGTPDPKDAPTDEERRPNILTLDDLRRALSGGEASQADPARAQDPAPEPTPETPEAPDPVAQTPAPEPEPPELQVEPTPSTLTTTDEPDASAVTPAPVDDGPLGSVAAEGTAGIEDTPPGADAGVPAQRRARRVQKSDPSKWVCKISAATDRPRGAVDRSSDSAFSVYFSSGDFALNRVGLEALTQNAGKIRQMLDAGDQVALVGNTDDVGDATANIILSLQRAFNVKACIMKLVGVPAYDVTVFGYGAFSPILEAPDSTAAGNRRVDILPLSEYEQRFETAFSRLNE
ncbi:MAG: OmpA family protein [Alphaproteobacteria bacterium]